MVKANFAPLWPWLMHGLMNWCALLSTGCFPQGLMDEPIELSLLILLL